MSSSETPIDCGPWTKKHLLGIEELSIAELETIFKASEFFVEASRNPEKKHTFLKGKVIANLFFESSTRTRVSFGLAARRLGAETIDFSPAGSSVSKGESFIDT
ncbi:MAG: hypothetical protein JHC56_11610, partial [Gemmataceae bacterium]|nr:hypothetical protein [Gemmataceae bacterium]